MSKLMEGILASAPEGTVTVINPRKIIQENREKLAKQLNKSVEELTDSEETEALHMSGMSVLDLQVP